MNGEFHIDDMHGGVESPTHASSYSDSGSTGGSPSNKKKSTYCKQYYERNREKRIQQSKEYQRRNRDKVQAYREQNREKELARMKVYNKVWYQQNREKVLARLKEYRKQNPEKEAKWVKDYRQRNKDKINQRKRERYSQQKQSSDGAVQPPMAGTPVMSVGFVLNTAQSTRDGYFTQPPPSFPEHSWLAASQTTYSTPLPPPKTSLSFLLNA